MKFAYLIEPPFNYMDHNGAVTGCDVELARHVFAELGFGTFEPVETAFADLLPGVADGRWQMTTGVFDTPERHAQARFSRAIWALLDGLLVRQGDRRGLAGYASLAHTANTRLAVIRDQFQHRSAIDFGVPDGRIHLFETYTEAAQAVRDGHVDAYASVGRAHMGFIAQNADWGLENVPVPADEKPPACGAFAFARGDVALQTAVDTVLAAYLGSMKHRRLAAQFGFSDAEVDLLMDNGT